MAEVDYDKIAAEVLAVGGKPSEEDLNSIVARVVEQLREKYPEAAEEGLWDQARDLYWKWKDSKRKTNLCCGEDAMACTDPGSIMED